MMIMPWLDPVREEFRERLRGDRLAHAILLSGPGGTGKLGLAMEMAAALLCLESSLPSCGKCRSCQLLVCHSAIYSSESVLPARMAALSIASINLWDNGCPALSRPAFTFT